MKNYWYLATPYSAHPGGLNIAHKEACEVVAKFIAQGLRIFSPIAHSHPIAVYGGLDPENHDLWLPLDRAFMDHACGIIVVRMAGWEESKGIAHEVGVFRDAGKPVLYCEP